jgi:hypothetical protein
MTHCAKCGAELIGSRKFCATCGAPVTDPRSTGANAAVSAGPPDPRPRAPSLPYGPPPTPQSAVNPFAQTANPHSAGIAPAYGPPPSAAPSEPGAPQNSPPRSSPISPLAASNVNSVRHAFQTATGGARAVPGLSSQGAPGTQLMPSVPHTPRSGSSPPSNPGAAGGGAASPRRQAAGTQLMGAFPPASAAAAQPQQSPPLPQAAPSPLPGAAQSPWVGWGAPSAPSYGPAPGAQVQVTWANGQRYPGTVQQVSGGQCLVAFPDGQQHWVPLQYVAPV